MRWIPWERTARIEEVRENIWRVISPIAQPEQIALQAGALLQMRGWEIATLGSLRFLLSEEVGRLTDELPRLARRLATTTELIEENHPARLRGPILWGKTLTLRGTTGSRSAFVTAPARRAYQTPENELLVHVLDAVQDHARRIGWDKLANEQAPATDVARIVFERSAIVARWKQSRALAQVERRRPNPRSLQRVRAGRHHRAYRSVIDSFDRLSELAVREDREAIKSAIEKHGIATRDDPTLFELLSLFKLRDALVELGWVFAPMGLIDGKAHFAGRLKERSIDLWYQTGVGQGLAVGGSRYAAVQIAHSIGKSELIPDVVIRERHADQVRWFIVEMKMSFSPPIRKTARRALTDLLAYRRAFDVALSASPVPYGLGLVWGQDLYAAPSEILLCSPDTTTEALSLAGFTDG